MGKFIKMAWLNLWRNWRRTAIAIIAIVLGVILLIFMDGLIKGSDQAMFGNAVRLYGGNIQTHAPGYRDKVKRLPLLPIDNADEIVKVANAQPEVVVATKRINTGGMVSNSAGSYPVVITGIEPAVEAPHSLLAENIVAGRFLLEGEGDAILIGKGLADALGLNAGDRVTLLGKSKNEQMRQRTMTIVGIFNLGLAEAEKGMVFIPLSKAQTLYNLRDQITEIAIVLDKIGQETAVKAAMQADLPAYEVDSWDTLRPEIRQTMETKEAFTGFFGIVVLLIASIGILNLLLMAVFERTREMGVLAALGMKGRELMGLFLLEGLMIGFVGAVIGCTLGGLINFAIAQVGMDMSSASGMGEITALMGDRIYPSFILTDIIKRGITVIIIAGIASLYPAWQASRKEPAESLHYI